MKKTLIFILFISVFPAFFNSCQKSGQVELGNFPSAWYFLGENTSEEPVFYLSCDGESKGIKIEKNGTSYELTIPGIDELSERYAFESNQRVAEVFEQFAITSFKINDDNTGEFSLSDPTSYNHLLSFKLAEDNSSAEWTLNGQFIGRFIADKMPDNIEKIYPPCIECLPFDECLDNISDPVEYIEMIDDAIEGSVKGIQRKDKTIVLMTGIDSSEYEVYYIKDQPVKVSYSSSTDESYSEEDIYYLRKGDLIESRRSKNIRHGTDGRKMTQEASIVYFREGMPVKLDRKSIEYFPDQGEFINTETNLPGFEELPFNSISFERDSLLGALDSEWKKYMSQVEGTRTLEGEFVELFLRYDGEQSLIIRDRWDRNHSMLVVDPDEWIRGLSKGTEMHEGRKVMVTWKYWESENEDEYPTSEPVYRHAVWLDEIIHIYTEPNQIRGTLREYAERKYYCTETAEGNHYQYHPACKQVLLGFSLEGNWGVPSLYIEEWDVYQYNIKELMLLTNEGIRILLCPEGVEHGPARGCVEIRPYDKGELVIHQMYSSENDPADWYSYYFSENIYDELPVSKQTCE